MVAKRSAIDAAQRASDIDENAFLQPWRSAEVLRTLVVDVAPVDVFQVLDSFHIAKATAFREKFARAIYDLKRAHSIHQRQVATGLGLPVVDVVFSSEPELHNLNVQAIYDLVPQRLVDLASVSRMFGVVFLAKLVGRN